MQGWAWTIFVISDYSFLQVLHTGESVTGYKIMNKKTLSLMSTNTLDDHFSIEIPSIGMVRDKKCVNDLRAYGWGWDAERYRSL